MDRTTRQTRTSNQRFAVREENGERRIEGYFATFGGIYELWPGATESIDPHAFDDALNGDVRCLIDHETRLVLGRNTAGTCDFRVDDHGLWASALINADDTDATNLYARVQRGDVSQGSFGFDILDETVDYHEDDTIHWTIKKVKLYEVSVVTFPAYRDTEIAARKADFENLRRRKVDAWKAEQKERLKKWH